MLQLLGFGKKRRSRRRSRKVKKGSVMRKPSNALLRLCKKLKVKTTMKRGKRRVYRKARLLKKLCKRKLRMLKKRLLKKKSKKVSKRKSVTRRKTSRKSSRKSSRKTKRKSNRKTRRKNTATKLRRVMGFGAGCGAPAYGGTLGFGSSIRFGNQNYGGNEFGKRRKRTMTKSSKAAAMKAFKQFYLRHCRGCQVQKKRSRRRFGFGSNPPLYQSMGHEFCGSGEGGVLGAGSTGLFPTPCTKLNAAQAALESSAARTVEQEIAQGLSKSGAVFDGQVNYGLTDAQIAQIRADAASGSAEIARFSGPNRPMFGKRRRARKTKLLKRKGRRSSLRKVKKVRKSTSGLKRRKSSGLKRRKSSGLKRRKSRVSRMSGMSLMY